LGSNHGTGRKKPEIMSPAGHWPQLCAAVEAGADAVYFGLKRFTARAKAGFEDGELDEAVRTLHRRGVKAYITLNTLVFDHELTAAASSIANVAAAGADAIIVQDLAMAQLARRIAPGLSVHGSTQMSVTSAEGIALAQQFGVTRVVLARELSLDEIRQIGAATSCELEIFVHGALCVSYSGQCFSSEAWGGRSANRGQCAQTCRLPYEMIVDGRRRPLGDARYLLSPGDLYTLREIPAILETGVASLKIEGRYKDAAYVALTTAAYRKAVDGESPTPGDELRLQQVYSRGMGPFFLNGTDHQAVVRGRAPRHRGVLAGRVAHSGPDSVAIEPTGIPLEPGDGVVFDAADWRSPQEPEEGGRVFEAAEQGALLRFGNRALDFSRIRPGDLVWRTHDPDLDREARRYTEAAAPVAKQPVHARLTAVPGEPLRTVWTLENGVRVESDSAAPLGEGRRRTLDVEFAREQLGRLGITPYSLASLEIESTGRPFAPASLLNEVRRQAVEMLQRAQSASSYAIAADPSAALDSLRPPPARFRVSSQARIHVLVRSPRQLDAAIEAAPASITLDYLDLYGLQPSIERVRNAGLAVRVASPRILKPGESRIVRFLGKLASPLLVRSGGLLHEMRNSGLELTGDFSLNAANAVSIRTYLDLGLERIAPTHDLNGEQIRALAGPIDPERLEPVAYQHLPVFHTEHCVFCRFLSTGASYLDCGRPCEKHDVEFKDESGRSHPVVADVGCRNTVFGAEAQEASAWLGQWRDSGIRHFRLEFVQETADQLHQIVAAFSAALNGAISCAELQRRLRTAAPRGITEGSLFTPPGFASFPILQ
jgi:putative protease